MSTHIINGLKFTDEQVLKVIIEHNTGVKWFDDALAGVQAKRDKRTRIANAINARQLDFIGKEPDRYREIRDRIEKEEKEKDDLLFPQGV